MVVRVEWIHAFLEIAKGPSTFRSTSQRWFHNKWRNCYRMNILSQKWANISYRKQRLLWIYNRAEWKTQKLEFSKSSSRFRTASQHWFQNNWRNHYRMNILVLNQENSFYRERKLQHSPISCNFFDEWDFSKHSHSQCCDAVQNHLEFFKILTPGAF